MTGERHLIAEAEGNRLFVDLDNGGLFIDETPVDMETALDLYSAAKNGGVVHLGLPSARIAKGLGETLAQVIEDHAGRVKEAEQVLEGQIARVAELNEQLSDAATDVFHLEKKLLRAKQAKEKLRQEIGVMDEFARGGADKRYRRALESQRIAVGEARAALDALHAQRELPPEDLSYIAARLDETGTGGG